MNQLYPWVALEMIIYRRVAPRRTHRPRIVPLCFTYHTVPYCMYNIGTTIGPQAR